ncbi:MAG: hypothetical protein ACXWZL_04755 [Mycobacterium sp.]
MTALDKGLALAAAAAVLLFSGCGSGSGEDTNTGSGNPSALSNGPTATTDAAQPAPLVIEVTIEGGEVSPTNAQLRAALAQPIVIRVYSDSADELHVHSTPEHTFDVGVGPGQSFQFTVDIPGRVDVELHQLHTTVATIQVR